MSNGSRLSPAEVTNLRIVPNLEGEQKSLTRHSHDTYYLII